ncbi:MAG: glycosyltransferase family 2 protein [bacterium]|nr:glycosyltransferase family 2 protein [bacterium]
MPTLPTAKIWVVLPAYNEEKYISTVLSKILKIHKQVVVIDDGSADETYAAAENFPIHLLRNRLNSGKGAALKTACEYAFYTLNAQAVIMMDADDQHDPTEIAHFIQALQTNEVVFGVREQPITMPWLRRKVNRLGSVVTQLLFGKYIPDIPSGYKAFTKKAYEVISWDASDYSVELEIAARTAKSNLPFSTIYITTIYHDLNKGMTGLDLLAAVKHLFALKVRL